MIYKTVLILFISLFMGCAVGSGRVGDCEAKGFSIGKSEVKAVCEPKEYAPLIDTTSLVKNTEDPEMVEVIKKVYEDEDDEFWKEYLKNSYGANDNVIVKEEKVVRIGGGPPTTSFWGTIGDVALSVVTFFVSRGFL